MSRGSNCVSSYHDKNTYKCVLCLLGYTKGNPFIFVKPRNVSSLLGTDVVTWHPSRFDMIWSHIFGIFKCILKLHNGTKHTRQATRCEFMLYLLIFLYQYSKIVEVFCYEEIREALAKFRLMEEVTCTCVDIPWLAKFLGSCGRFQSLPGWGDNLYECSQSLWIRIIYYNISTSWLHTHSLQAPDAKG